MSAEDTELTFIRCPSCRSLIPAVASRCRMCGCVLEETASGSSEQTPLQPEPNQDRTEQAVAEPQSPVAPKAVPVETQVAKEAPRSRRPSSASMLRPGQKPATDASAASANVALGASSQASQPKASEPKLNRHEAIVHGEESFSEDVHQGIPDSVPAEAKSQEMSEIDRILEKTNTQPEAPRPEQDHEHSEDGRKRKRKRKRKKRDTSSMSLDTLENNNSHQHGEDLEEEIVAVPEKAKHPAPEARKPAQQHNQPAVQQEPRRAKNEQPRNEQQKNGQGDRNQGDRNRGGRNRAAHPQQNKPEHVQAERRPVEERREVPRAQNNFRVDVAPSSETPLVAWFVNYKEEKGRATEVREGRFFISGELIKETDLVIKSETVSSPHCIIKAQAGVGVMVQDLMSEEGTHLQKAGKDKYKAVDGAVAVNHGDKLKFGDYEVLVCLLPTKEKEEKKTKK